MAEGIRRIEAFSDGVFAIASTLLILEIRLLGAGVVYLAATAIALVAPYVALAINVAVRLHLLRIRYQLAPAVPTREGQSPRNAVVCRRR